MPYFYFVCLNVLLFISCNTADIRTKPELLKIGRLRFTTYRFYPNDSTQDWHTHIINYVEIDSTGKYSIIRQEPGEERRRFNQGMLPQEIRARIDSSFYNRSYDSAYLYDPLKGYTYHGSEFILDYSANNKRSIIQFIPPEAPNRIKTLCKALDTLMFYNPYSNVDTINLQGYESEIDSLGKRIMVMPPPIIESPKLNIIQFRPPKKQKTKSR